MEINKKIPNKKKGNQPKVFLGAVFSDGGGILITIDVFGGAHIKRIPPRQDDVQRLIVASNLLEQSEKVESRETRKQIHDLAEQIVKDAFPAFQSRLVDMGVAEDIEMIAADSSIDATSSELPM
jgi:hypothetical protein